MPKERPSTDEAAEASTPLKPKLDDAATEGFVAVDDAAAVEVEDAVVDPPPPTTPGLTRAPLPTTPKPSLSLEEGAGADEDDETAEPTPESA